MSTRPYSLLLVIAGTIAVLASCKKTDDSLSQPQPAPVDTTSYVQFTANGVQLAGGQLYALVSLKNNNGQEVVANKKVTLDNIQGTYKTDKIQLVNGGYKLSKFIVLASSDTAKYATPRANTPAASQVANPLDFAFSLSAAGVSNKTIQVVKVNDTDDPANFGYDENDFGFVPFITLKAKLKVTVGQVAYDSLPGRLLITATKNTGGGTWSREIDLQKGVTEIKVPGNFSDYKFEAQKWNVSDIKNMARAALQPGTEISLEAFRQAKRLIEEATFIENSAALIADTRTDYYYGPNNSLQEIKNYQRSLQVSGLVLTNVYKFRYSGTLLDSIYRYDATNAQTGYTAFAYQGGKISSIANQSYDQFTGAAFSYTQLNGNNLINADYIFQNGNSMTYVMRFRNGNKISDQAFSSTGGSEGGSYTHDDNINPKHQLGYPDLFLSNSSKNNLMSEQKGYAGVIPQVVPYKFEYLYDEDGYPTEVYVSYKGYTSQQHLYRIKKTYKYQ